ncbi:MAG: aminopeptidase [Christensenella sp.]|nr:aminopeptidase [Christensenella sp.]
MECNENIVRAAKSLIKDCLGAKKDETILVATDDGKIDIAYCFAKAGRELGIETVLVDSHAQAKGEPSKMVADAMLEADVEFLITTMSYSHTNARIAANKKGARVASMPMMTMELADNYLDGDYKFIQTVTKKLADMIDKTKVVRVVTEAGTDLTFKLGGRKCEIDDGNLTQPGCIGNLPAGEAYIAPVETTGDGVLVIDGVIAYLGQVKDSVKLTLEGGRIREIEGGVSAQELRDFLKDKDSEATGIAEFGIGTNPKAKLIGSPLLDEKVWGTIHIAFGTNKSMGGERESNIHYDCIINEPTVYLDGVKILDKGEHIY